LLIAYVVVVVLLGFLQRKLIYHPVTVAEMPVANFRNVTHKYPGARDVRIACADECEIGGWWLRRSAGDQTLEAADSRPLVIYFHGNAGNRAGRGGWYDVLHPADVDILAVDYHGYGDSTGVPTEETLYTCVRATWEYAVQDLDYAPSRIVVMGVSLGGAAAVHLAAETCESGISPAGLITVATFNSMTDVASRHYPWLPVRAVLVDRYPSSDKIACVTCPILQLHGDQDTIVHESCGRALFDAAPAHSASGIAKRWVGLRQTGHNDLLLKQEALFVSELDAFINSVVER
jgi:pimeloyl-ACP methyl ester carboxylesterase